MPRRGTGIQRNVQISFAMTALVAIWPCAAEEIIDIERVYATAPRFDSPEMGGRLSVQFGRALESVEFRRAETSDRERDSSESPCDKANPGGTMRGNPINIATGNKLEPEFDFATGGEWPLTLSRTYNWLWSAPGPGLFGTKWMSSLDYRLGFQRDSCYPSPGVPECTDTGGALRVYAYRPDGRKLQFSRQPTGDFRETKGLGRILKQPDGSWVHYTEDNMIEHYSVGGFPLSIRNSAGVGWTFRYGGTNNTQPQEVSHTSGRSIALAWQGSELREVRDPAGQVYRFW